MKDLMPNNETARLEVLGQYNILDTPPEEAFDDFTNLATQICQTPIALITFIEQNRQWVKASVGLSITELPCELSFCAHALEHNEVFIIQDALADPRFASHPLVISEPYIRFYAGAPLITPEGYTLGSLCVIDHTPRELTPEQLTALKTLSRQVIAQLELRRTLAALEQATQQRQNLEQELHGRQRELFDVLENGTTGLHCVDANGIILWANQAELDLLGYSHQEYIGRPIAEFHADPPIISDILCRLTANETLSNYPARLRCKDGSIRHVLINSNVAWEDGKFSHTRCFTRDITELKQAEEERDALRSTLQRLFDLSLDLLCIAGVDGYFKRLNPAWEKNLGYSHQELQSRPFLDYVHPDDQKPTLTEVKKLTVGTPSINFENRYRCKDGSYKWLAWKAISTVEDGLIYAIARDITQLKQAEQERLQFLQREQAARNQITKILESITDAFFALDDNWHFTYVNQQAEHLLQRQRQELLGQCIWDEFPEAIGSTFYLEYHRAIREQVSVEFEAFYFPLNTWFFVHAYPGEQGLSVYFEDINERKQAEEALRETTQLQRAILDSANYTIISTTSDGIICTFNAAAERLLGYSAQEIVGKQTPLVIHDRQEILQRSQQLTQELGIPIQPGFETFVAKARTGGLDEQEWTYIRKDGSRFPVLLSVTALRDGEGNITGFLGIGSDITERKRFETALKESEERWQLALRGNNDGIWDWNLVTNEVFFSTRWKEMLGYTDSEISHHLDEWSTRAHPDDIGWVTQAIQDHLAQKTPFYISEHRIRCKDGTYKWILDRGQALWNAQGQPVRMAGSHTDITERKQAEAALETRVQQQAAIATLGQRALASQDLSALMNEATELVAQSLGVEYCKVLELLPERNVLLLRAGVGWHQGLMGRVKIGTHVDSQAGYTLAVNQPVLVEDLRTETRFSGPVLLHEHGVVSGLSVVIPGSNRPFGVLGAHTSQKRTFTQENVHFLQTVANTLATAMERQQAEAELQRQNRRSQLFAEITLKIRQSLQLNEILQTTVTEVQKILQVDRVLLYRVWPNGTGCTVTEAVRPGWPQILGMTFEEEVFPTEYQELYRQGQIRAIADVEKAYAEVTPCLLEFLKPWGVKAKLVVPILMTDDWKEEGQAGQGKLDSTTISPASSSNSPRLWGLLIAHHCTSPRQWTIFETELLQQLSEQIGLALAQSQRLERETRQRQELTRSNAELQEFAYVASHDLQEPLRKIQAFGDRLKVKYSEVLTDQGRDYLERMQNAAGRMQALIDDLLTLSRVTTRAQPFVPLDLTQAVNEVLSDLEVRIQQTQAQIEVGTLPTLEADPIQMRQLLQNLIGNALKFSSEAQPPRIQIYSQQLYTKKQRRTPGNSSTPICQIFIQDNGIGFEEKYLDRIFNAFQRLHSRREYEGTGMGLAICRKIVERHNGSITAQSVPQKGSTFLITLPLQQRQGDTVT
jgi:PAS domain S-box-containing protein